MELFNHFLDLVTLLTIFRSWGSILDHFLLSFHFIFFHTQSLLRTPDVAQCLECSGQFLLLWSQRQSGCLCQKIHIYGRQASPSRGWVTSPLVSLEPPSPSLAHLLNLISSFWFSSLHCCFLRGAFAGQPATSGPALIGPRGHICFSFGVASFD